VTSSNSDVVAEVYAAWARRDLDAFPRLAHPEIEMDLTDRVLNPDVYKGYDGLRRFLAEIDDLWERMEMGVERVTERGDEVLVIVRVRLRGKGSGVELESVIAQHWRLRDRKVLHMKLWQDADAALAEFEVAASR
jgi:ketosteroid isomerase-like protein